MSMNQENHVLTLARKAQLICDTAPVAYWQENVDMTPYLDRFYQLVRNKALEDVAKYCDDLSIPQPDQLHSDAQWAAKVIATNIRQMKDLE